MKNIVLILFLIFGANYLLAQDITDNKLSREIGLNAGFTTGIGLTYRRWKNDLGFQITVLPIKIENGWTDLAGVQDVYSMYFPFIEDAGTFISLGLAGLLNIRQHKLYKVFVYAGNHILITEANEIYNIGGGLGISFEMPVSFNLMFGYQGFDLFNNYSLMPSIEISALFKLPKK